MSKIVIIDDSHEMIHLFQEMVSILGHEVQAASGGRTGLTLMRTFDPDLVLLDLMMPDMNGWQVYEEMRRFSTVPVIFITADFNSGNIARAMELGEQILEKNTPLLKLRDAIDLATSR